MVAQDYDEIAEPYQALTKGHKLSHIAEYTVLSHAGEVSGKSVLDLGCGEGHYTREYKRLGASRVVGVDISARMLELAWQQETEDPLGIEYRLSSVETLCKVGDFDLVTAVFVFNYAQTKEQLLRMCQTASDNLKPGERFLAANFNPEPQAAEYPRDAFEKYGCSQIQVPQPLQEGAAIRVTVGSGDQAVQFDNYYLSIGTYEWALKTAGFATVNWHRLLLPPDIEQQDGVEFWAFFLEAFPFVLIECVKHT